VRCPVCGTPFIRAEGEPGRPRVFCSDACRRQAARWRTRRDRLADELNDLDRIIAEFESRRQP